MIGYSVISRPKGPRSITEYPITYPTQGGNVQTIVAIDIGTTGAKAALVGQNGQVLAHGYAAYPTQTGEGNRVEQQPADWWDATCVALAHLWASVGVDRSAIAAIALSGQMQDLILLGAEDVLRPAILYSDQRAQAEAGCLESTIGYAELARITGNEQGAASLLAKWRWLQEHEPATLAACQTILLGAHSYVGWRLSGAVACDYTTASTTGLLDLLGNDWAADLLVRLGLQTEKLPPLLAADAQIGVVTQTAAAATGLPAGLAVYTGAGDLAATTVGVGAGEPGRLYCYLGSSGWIALSLAHATPNPQGGVFTLRHPDPTRFIQVAPMLTAGGNLDWVRTQIVCADDYTQINQLAAAAPAGSHGVLYLPYLAGERSPFSDPLARACYIGISGRAQRCDLVRAVMEGSCFAYRALLETLTNEVAALYVVGGGAQSSVWMQILADVIGCPVKIVANPADAAARGAAIMVGRALGWYDGFTPNDAFFPVAQTLLPKPTTHAIYQALYPVFTDLYPQLRASFSMLAQISLPA